MSEELSRRRFGRTLGGVTGSAAMPALASGRRQTPKNDYYRFPKNFLWGCATAAYQVEGAANVDGRGLSIWDTFSRIPGKTFRNQTGDVADDHYHRYKEDIQLMKWLGVKAYRFSVSWPRVFPDGTGNPNPKGLDFYNRLIDELRGNGIEPFCTLFHWDLPESLQANNGGWESRTTAERFADYAGYVASKLSDRVRHFFTVNEFASFIDLGYKDGLFAPGLKLPPKRLNQARHNAVLAHGLAVKSIRAQAHSGTKVGLAENYTPGIPVYEADPHIEAAVKATRVMNAPYLTVIMEGKYMEEYLEQEGSAAPKFSAEDLSTISSPLNFVGSNVYTPTYIRADETKLGFVRVNKPSSYPHMASPWLDVGPEALYWAPRHLTGIWKVREIYITENGCSSADVLTPEGQVWDTDRVMYLRNYIGRLQRATSEGLPVRGYFLWSLMDNFEWADGYNLRFGIYYVDYATQKRYPKLSAHFYKETIARNAVL